MGTFVVVIVHDTVVTVINKLEHVCVVVVAGIVVNKLITTASAATRTTGNRYFVRQDSRQAADAMTMIIAGR